MLAPPLQLGRLPPSHRESRPAWPPECHARPGTPHTHYRQPDPHPPHQRPVPYPPPRRSTDRSEEHTSELQSHSDLVCRLLLEKKKKTRNIIIYYKTKKKTKKEKKKYNKI